MTSQPPLPIEDAKAQFAEMMATIEAYLMLDLGDQEIEAPVVMRVALGFIARLCGGDMIRAAYGNDPPLNDRAACLSALSERLWLASHLFSSTNPTSGSSLPDAALEAFLVAGGDQPRLFGRIEQKPGEKRNAHELAVHQLSALCWEAYLEGAGMNTATRRARVTIAFGVGWDTMRKWATKQLADAFGEPIVQTRLAAARLEGGIGLPIPFDRIDADGTAYKRAQGFNV